MIDSHCHLADKQFDTDRDAMITRAKEAGVMPLISIADNIDEAEKCRVIAEKNEHIYYTAGFHPLAAELWSDTSIEKLRAELSHTKCVAVGEIGLDYHYTQDTKDIQKEIFRAQLDLALELDLPAVIHCREAVEDVREIVLASGIRKFVIHCCTEKWEDISWAIDAGGLLSFTGVATYPKALAVHNTIVQCPLDRMMIETDAPYLAPEPHRSKRNEPAFVTHVCDRVAELKGIGRDKVDAQTTQNAIRFYALPS